MTRRHVLAGGLLATGLATLPSVSACGSKHTSDNPTETAAATRAVKDYFGTVTLPAHPKRIVAAEGVSFGHIASLGITPVAAAVNPNSIPHYQAAQLKGALDVSAQGDSPMDLEKALTTKPDLIVTAVGEQGDLYYRKEYESYQKVVPTYGFLYGFSYIEQVVSGLKAVATALNVEAKADELMRRYDARATQLKSRIHKAHLDTLPVTTLRISQGSYSIRMGTAESIAFRALGMLQPAGQRDVKKFDIELSLEKFDILNQAETLFVYTDDNAAADNKKVMSSPIWKSLDPVKRHRVVEVSSGVWNSRDIGALMTIFDDIEKGFVLPHGG